MSDQQSIKNTLNVIKKALEDDEFTIKENDTLSFGHGEMENMEKS